MKTFAISAQLCILVLGVESLLMGQTVINGSRVMMGSWNASSATHTLPSKTGTTALLPSTCTLGEEYFATDAPAGQNQYNCTAANVWTQSGTFLQIGAGAVARTLTSKLQDVVQVKDFGAKGNGVTDDSAAFIAALASGAGEVRADAGTYIVNSVITLAKGQKLYFGVGTHTVGGIRFTDSLTDQTGTGKIECAGAGQTTLLLKNGANLDVISQTNFAALTGRNSPFGLFRGEIHSCTIDGNRINQTGASYGIRLYGHGLDLVDVTVRNAFSDGIYTEWGLDATFLTPITDLQGYFYGVRSSFNNGNGWTFRGPRDSDFVNTVLDQNGGWGLQVQTSTTYIGSGHLANLNTFLNTLGGIYSNGTLDGSQVTASTAAGWGMLIDAGAGSHNLTAVNFSGPTGLEVRAPSQIISGNIANTSTAGLRFNGGSGNFNLQMFNNTGYQVDFANELGPTVLFADSANAPPGAMFNGTPSQLDFIFADFGGAVSNRYIAFPTPTVHVAGWSPQFPASNAVMAVVGDPAQTGNLYATNLSLSSSAQVGSSTFSSLGTAANGNILYCSNCTQTTPCTAGGTGALATAVGGAWSCGGGSGGATYTFRDDLTNASNTVDFNPFDTGLFLIDEFMPNIRASVGNFGVGTLGWGLSCVGGASCYSGAIADPGGHPGIFRISGGNTVAGMGASLTLADVYDTPSGVMPVANMGTGGNFTYWETQAIVETDLNSVSASKYLVGFADNTTAYHPASGNQIAVRYDTAGGGCAGGESTVDWVYEVIVAGTQFCVDSGVVVTAATWYKIRIYSSTPGTINFQIGVSAGALGSSGSIAHAPTAALTPDFVSLNVGTGVYHYLSIDRWAIKIRGINR